MPRVPVEYRSASKETYKKFCSLHPDIKISFDEWKEIIYTHNEYFREYPLESGDRIKMRWGLGPFAINKRKIKKFKNFKDEEGNPYVNLRVDWAKTKKLGKRIYHTNTHTDGYQLSWLWTRGEARFYQSSIWNFKPARETSRLIKTYVKRDPEQFQIYKTWKQ